MVSVLILGQETQMPILDDFFEIKFLDFPAGIHRPAYHTSLTLAALARYAVAYENTQAREGKPPGLHTRCWLGVSRGKQDCA